MAAGESGHLNMRGIMPMLVALLFADLDQRVLGPVYVIVILALIAGFLALRLYSVLGKRTGHEQEPALRPAEERAKVTVLQPRPMTDMAGDSVRLSDGLIASGGEVGVRALIAADRSFDVPQFVEGAKTAYKMVLEAFWRGDRHELEWLCDADVLSSFEEAIAAREAAGHVLDNRLVRIERAQIVDASVNGRIAEVSLRFEADIAAVTRDKDGNVVAGSLTDAVSTNDIWTFTRDLRSTDPNWKLSETDEAA